MPQGGWEKIPEGRGGHVQTSLAKPEALLI